MGGLCPFSEQLLGGVGVALKVRCGLWTEVSPEVWVGVASGTRPWASLSCCGWRPTVPPRPAPHETQRRGEQGPPAASGLQWGHWRSWVVGGAGGSRNLNTQGHLEKRETRDQLCGYQAGAGRMGADPTFPPGGAA